MISNPYHSKSQDSYHRLVIMKLLFLCSTTLKTCLAHHACHCHNVGLEAKNMLQKYHIGLACIVKLVPKKYYCHCCTGKSNKSRLTREIVAVLCNIFPMQSFLNILTLEHMSWCQSTCRLSSLFSIFNISFI